MGGNLFHSLIGHTSPGEGSIYREATRAIGTTELLLTELGQTDHVLSKFVLDSSTELSGVGRRIFRSSALARPWGRRLENQLRGGVLDDNECLVASEFTRRTYHAVRQLTLPQFLRGSAGG